MNELLERFRQTNALLEGHFILSSGLHSPMYLQSALALKHSADAAEFGRIIAQNYLASEIDLVASPAIGGLVVGFATAQALNKPFVWTERQDGQMALRRGFTFDGGERILVVEDVITTGGSTRECISVLEHQGADVVAAASIVDRSGGEADVGVPRTSLITLDIPTYPPNKCPLCESGEPALKPGSRTFSK